MARDRVGVSPGNPALALRRMRAADIEDVLRIERASHRNPWSENLLLKELELDWSTVLLGQERDPAVLPLSPSKGQDEREAQRLVGYVVFWIVHGEAHILNVSIDPERRRRGYGRTLMLAAEEQSRSRGAVSSVLEVRRSNEAAVGLYRDLGYRQVGVRPRYYADNDEDALIMEKDLTGAQAP